MVNSLIQEVVEHLEALPQDVQEQVLSLVRTLDSTAPSGVAGIHLLQFAGTISNSELERMTQAIEQGCEQIDSDDW